MKKYVFEVVIEEGNDEFWEDLDFRGLSGCDEVTDMHKVCLEGFGIDATIQLKEYNKH